MTRGKVEALHAILGDLLLSAAKRVAEYAATALRRGAAAGLAAEEIDVLSLQLDLANIAVSVAETVVESFNT